MMAAAAALLFVLAGDLLAQGHVEWARSWEDALAEAKARNVPLHVAIHKDG